MTWSETKWVIHEYPPYLTETSHSKLPSHHFKKEDGGLGDLPNSFAYLITNLGICIEEGDLNKFVQVITILANLYWKHSLLIKKCWWNT